MSNPKIAKNPDGTFKDPDVESFYQETNSGSHWHFVIGLPEGKLIRNEWVARLNLGKQLGFL